MREKKIPSLHIYQVVVKFSIYSNLHPDSNQLSYASKFRSMLLNKIYPLFLFPSAKLQDLESFSQFFSKYISTYFCGHIW